MSSIITEDGVNHAPIVLNKAITRSTGQNNKRFQYPLFSINIFHSSLFVHIRSFVHYLSSYISFIRRIFEFIHFVRSFIHSFVHSICNHDPVRAVRVRTHTLPETMPCAARDLCKVPENYRQEAELNLAYCRGSCENGQYALFPHKNPPCARADRREEFIHDVTSGDGTGADRTCRNRLD